MKKINNVFFYENDNIKKFIFKIFDMAFFLYKIITIFFINKKIVHFPNQ